MRLSIIVAMDRKRLIGDNNALPWHLPADLAHFKRTTMGRTIVMGRKTFESIGKPLPGRTNVVLSRTPNLQIPGVRVLANIEDVARVYRSEAEVFIIGGASIYQQLLGDNGLQVARIYLTQVEGDFTGDAYFPEFKRADFIEISRESHQADAKNAVGCEFIILERRK